MTFIILLRTVIMINVGLVTASLAIERHNDLDTIHPNQIKILNFTQAKKERQCIQNLLTEEFFPHLKVGKGQKRNESTMRHARSEAIKTIAHDFKICQRLNDTNMHPMFAMLYDRDVESSQKRLLEVMVFYQSKPRAFIDYDGYFSFIVSRKIISPLLPRYYDMEFEECICQIMATYRDSLSD